MQKENDDPRKSRKRRARIEESDDDETTNDETTYSSTDSDYVEESVEYLDKEEEELQNLDEEVEAEEDEEKSYTEGGFREEDSPEEVEEEPDVIERAVRCRNLASPGYGKDIGILFGTTAAMGTIAYLFIMLLGLTIPSRPLVVPKGAVKPFFIGMHRRVIEDCYDGELKLAPNQTLSVLMLYSPYSIRSRWFRDDYFNAARMLKKQHGNLAPYFGASNCFDSGSYCRSKYNLKQYPMLMVQNPAQIVSIYNGPLNTLYFTRWLNRLHHAVVRLQSAADLEALRKHHDLIVILFYQIRTPPGKFQSAMNFTKMAFHYLDGDPNSERTVFCIVTDPKFATLLQLHNEHDVVLVSAELKLLATHYKGWTYDAVYSSVLKYAKSPEQSRVEFLNLGEKVHSTQLAKKFEKSSVLMFFSSDMSYGSEKYRMLKEIEQDYRSCPQQELLSVENETEEVKFQEDCTLSLESCFCKSNNTLSFLAIDSTVETPLAVKYGAEDHDMVIAINSKQEITRYIRGNVTRESINCLIRQHHNAADNKFVTEATNIITKKTQTPDNLHEEAIGRPSFVKFVSNATALLISKNINVILFSGGTWHAASTAAIAPIHLAADHFRESRNIINFSMVDVSETSLPYNLDFEQLPKILITSADSIGLSWTFPEDIMINHTNIVRFVLTRPGKIFGRLRWMDSCQGLCRKRSRWQMRHKRLQLKRQLDRNVANSMRQRRKLGYFDRMLRMIN